MSVTIVGYTPRYADVFAQLNYQWIEHYFAVEPEDRLALDNPYEYAIEPGGEIFFILLDELVVGCAAMVPKQWAGATVAEFELAKMAVRPDIQGQGLGQQLLERCIQYAKEQGASRVVLTTNDILTPALKVYHKVGFVDLPSNPDTRYARGNLAMVLELEQG
ncbi:MAG: GNAT family N-acetyltransferase [Pseudomonadota bacterium]|nr:GNAT family N-acetyltransferase [Pseudomonadota bacterium]